MKVFKSKTIDGFAKLNQAQASAIRGGCCTGNGQDPPPEEPPKSTMITTNVAVLGG